MTLLLDAVTAAGAAACEPWLKSRIFAHSVGHSRPLRNRCSRCHTPLVTSRLARQPVTGRCPLRRQRIGPATTTAALTTAIVTAVIASHSINPLTAAALLWIAWHGIIILHPAATISAQIAIITVGILAAAILLATKRIQRHQACAHRPVMPSGTLIAYVQIA